MKAKLKKRNPYAFDPIMRKGGVHEKTTKAKRRKYKLQMQKEAANWQPYLFLAFLKKSFSTKMFLETKISLKRSIQINRHFTIEFAQAR